MIERVLWASGVVLAFGCGEVSTDTSGSRSTTPDASAGGGGAETGGNASTGGRISTGGNASTGGRIGTGGNASTGGRIGTGGAPSTGGNLGSGGSETDGSVGAGGSPGPDGSTVSSGGSSDSGAADATSSGGADGGTVGDAGGPLLPIAANSGHWQWQGQQREVRLPNGATCASKIAIALGVRGVCYEHARDGLVCTGRVHTRDYGPTFLVTGIKDVDQVSMSPTTGSSDDDVCAHTGSTLQCFGANYWGQLGTGVVQPVPDWISWGGRNDIVAFGFGTWNNICVLDTQGSVRCAGAKYGPTPVLYDQSSGHTSFWIHPTEYVFTDDTSVLRSSESRTECKITTSGLDCLSILFGTAGAIVMGGSVDPSTAVSQQPFYGPTACWLESTGEVYCAFKDTSSTRNGQMQVFPGRPVLALATQYYSNQICAVMADAAVECVRVVIDTGAVTTGPMAPAGSAMIGCP